ncbi:uncharacterized protein LOC106869587 [Octopus bimaculoides]|uniref:uncharacterized protein LOC106869587 n=1 Tax=Octopus bimaculoides TaxID=37653 RepID=UPI00071E5C99|nr:uncharacterized protein LOC106869587 [Octopus bimaculoides]|eukprot:XP_014770876.1 PREDICTED: uncharacterized protein LOC106869587 [Octopus bimaculoides]
MKPQYHKPNSINLIKVIQPFERISIDFKGPIPSTMHPYLLTIIDEYSRFPFGYPVSDTSAQTVIKCLTDLFSVFGMLSYVHSDRGTAFMSTRLREWHLSKGIATSRTMPYNPTGNSQVERYNGIIWKSVLLSLKTRALPVSLWGTVLPHALHSIRSLLCTSTNATPHERLFNYQRRSASATSMPTWLLNPGPVLVQRNNRTNKYDPIMDQVDLIEANSQYAHVRYPDSRETKISTKQLTSPGKINPTDNLTQTFVP